MLPFFIGFEDVFDLLVEEARYLERKRQTRIVLAVLNGVDGLAGNGRWRANSRDPSCQVTLTPKKTKEKEER